MIDRSKYCDECYLDLKLCGKIKILHCIDCLRKALRSERA